LNDESVLPFLSQFDPPLQAEGSLDPLGLYSIADALGVRLAPGVRERQVKPRYLTLALVGMAACGDAVVAAGEAKRLPAWLVYEWLVVEALMRRAEGGVLSGIPGRDKVLSTIAANDVVCMRTYLKTPTVFGFHGVYRVLGLKAGIFDGEGHPLEHGYRVLSAWQEDQGLAGFLEGQGPGRELRLAIERVVASSIQAGYAKDPGSATRKLIAEHLNPHEPGPKERNALWTALTHNDVLRAEYATLLVTSEGQAAWLEAEGSEAGYHQWLEPHASLPMQQLLKAIRTYERLARLLMDAFDEARWRMTEARGPVDGAWLSQGTSMREAALHAATAFLDAVKELGEVDPALRLRAEKALAWVGETKDAAGFAEQLLEHHSWVQGAKPPNGKRAWFDVFGDGRVAIRPGYTLAEFEARSDRYVHAYRTKPIWSFASDLGRVDLSKETT
jgi:hypothetical protein